ncbi:hypothetical protein BJ741DRAFT_606460 [Chytriomyces cf. hyalinus JEL632]|nr:hypothetical protein BJ741DRAFT_606460 [Chytriomyces cf. hyalinus JEL632]
MRLCGKGAQQYGQVSWFVWTHVFLPLQFCCWYTLPFNSLFRSPRTFTGTPFRYCCGFYVLLNIVQVVLYGHISICSISINTYEWAVWMTLVNVREWMVGFLLTHRLKAVTHKFRWWYYLFGAVPGLAVSNWLAVAFIAPYPGPLFEAVFAQAKATDLHITLVSRLSVIGLDVAFAYFFVTKALRFTDNEFNYREQLVVAAPLLFNCGLSILLSACDLYRVTLPKTENVGGWDFLARLSFDFYIIYFLDFTDKVDRIMTTVQSNFQQDGSFANRGPTLMSLSRNLPHGSLPNLTSEAAGSTRRIKPPPRRSQDTILKNAENQVLHHQMNGGASLGHISDTRVDAAGSGQVALYKSKSFKTIEEM